MGLENDADDLGLIPCPARVERRSGTCLLTKTMKIAAYSGLPEMKEVVSQLFQSLPLPQSAKNQPGIRLTDNPELANEAYSLEITPQEVTIGASGRNGILMAFQTVRALVLGFGPEIPCVRISDFPRFPWRGCMLDTSRHYFPVPWILSFIDAMALLKLNVFHWHLTDDQGFRMEIPSLPGFTEKASERINGQIIPPETERGFYSLADMKTVLAFAQARGITVLPEIEMPGHVTALLSARPDLACTPGPFRTGTAYGIYKDVLCTGNPEVLRFLSTVLDDVISVFPSTYIHLGGDEVLPERWDGCPKCTAFRKKEGLADAKAQQGRFTQDMYSALKARNRKLAAWDEILEGSPDPDVLVFSWRGARYGLEAANRGHDVIMCPFTDGCYLNFKHRESDDEPGRLGVATVKDSYSFDPLAGFEGAEKKTRDHVQGLQGNIWTEELRYGKWVEYQAFPRLSALAETGWTAPNRKDFKSFTERLPMHLRNMRSLGMNVYEGPLE